MPHVVSRIPRMPQRRHPVNRNISPSIVQVIVKMAGKQEHFALAGDISVKQFKEKLCAHFKCKMDQLVLVFMGRLLKDQDTLNQRGIVDGHTIHVVIRSKHGSRSLAGSSQNLSTNRPCHQERTAKRNSRVGQSVGASPAKVDPAKVEATPLVESNAPKVCAQDLEVDGPQHSAQMPENLSVRRLMSNMDFMRQLFSENPDMQQVVQQNPELSHLLDNSEVLWQTIELTRSLAIIQEIMQNQQPVQNLEQLLAQPYVSLETISSILGQNHDDFNVQILNSMQDLLGIGPFASLLEGQVLEQVQSSPRSPPSSQDQLPPTHTTHNGSHGLLSVASTHATPNRTSGDNPTTVTTRSSSQVCAAQQLAGVPTLPSAKVSQELQTDGKDATVSLGISDQWLEDLQLSELSEEQASSQITGSVMQLLRNHPHVAAQMLSLPSAPQLSEQWRQQLSTSLQSSQISDLLSALANPKASQAISQIEHGLQLLATEAPILLPWIEPYFWGLDWLPVSNCNYPDTTSWTWNTPDMAEPKWPECCHKPGVVVQRLQPQSGEPSHPLQVPEIRFSKQMESLKAMGFVNHYANLEALIATDGDTNAAIRQLMRPQEF